MDNSTAIALAGMAIAAGSLLMGVIVFASSQRRGLLDELKDKVKELQTKVDRCEHERASDRAEHAAQLARQRDSYQAEIADIRQQHRQDVERLDKAVAQWQERYFSILGEGRHSQ